MQLINIFSCGDLVRVKTFDELVDECRIERGALYYIDGVYYAEEMKRLGGMELVVKEVIRNGTQLSLILGDDKEHIPWHFAPRMVKMVEQRGKIF